MPTFLVNILRSVMAAWTAIVLLFAGGAPVTVMDFAGDKAIQAAAREYVFDDVRGDGRLLFGGYNYNTAYSDAEHVGWVKEAGLDFLVSSANAAFLDECERQGVGVIAKGYNKSSPWLNFTQANLDNWQTLTADNYKSHPALWGDSIVDEPVYDSLERVGQAVAHYNGLGLNRLALVNINGFSAGGDQLAPAQMRSFYKLLPWSDYNHDHINQYTGYVAAYAQTVDSDIFSHTLYPMQQPGTPNGWSGCWLRQLDIHAELARETGRDMWVITQAAGYTEYREGIESARYCDTVESQLQQDYAALAFGARGIIYACYQGGWWETNSHMINAAGQRTDTYYAVQAANEELAPIKDIWADYQWQGAYLLNHALVDGLRGMNGLPGVLFDLRNGLSKKARPKLSSKDGLLVGCFQTKECGGKAYVVVNMMDLLDEKTATCTVTFPQSYTVTVYGGSEVKTYTSGGKIELTLAPGDGRFITVK